jgi:hypothetical protein
MLVVEDRYRASGSLEDFDDLFEPLVARVEFLSEFVAGILTVLADEHDAVHGQFISAQSERFRDGWE